MSHNISCRKPDSIPLQEKAVSLNEAAFCDEGSAVHASDPHVAKGDTVETNLSVLTTPYSCEGIQKLNTFQSGAKRRKISAINVASFGD